MTDLEKEKTANEVQLNEQSICKKCGYDNSSYIKIEGFSKPVLAANYCGGCGKKIREVCFCCQQPLLERN